METIFIWYGHAAFGLTIGDDRILIDPFLTGNPAATVKAAELDADYILITHGHGDHLGDTLPIARRTKALCVSNFEICSWLSAKGADTHAQHIGGGIGNHRRHANKHQRRQRQKAAAPGDGIQGASHKGGGQEQGDVKHRAGQSSGYQWA